MIYLIDLEIDAFTRFVSPPHMLITFREGKKVIIPLKRTSKGEWRDALNGTQSGRITCTDKIEKAYMDLLNREIVG